MSNYRAGDVIRMTRTACGISQEELSFGICSVQTLHRIENGKTRVKKKLYYRLMEKMERVPEKSYAVCVGKDMELLEERTALEDALNKMEYDKAAELIKIIRDKADDNLITEQYVRKAEALIAYDCKTIDAKMLIERLEETIGLTVPNYKDCLGKKYPFTAQELFCLQNIANACHRQDKYKEAIKLYEKVLECLDMEYIFGGNTEHLRIITIRSLSRTYGSMKDYKKANELSKIALEMALEENEGIVAEEILTDMVWNVLRQIECREREEGDKTIAKKILRQAYFIAFGRGDERISKICENVYKSEFKERIK